MYDFGRIDENGKSQEETVDADYVVLKDGFHRFYKGWTKDIKKDREVLAIPESRLLWAQPNKFVTSRMWRIPHDDFGYWTHRNPLFIAVSC